jgi:CubicO group peptidase (beta-lactamase class C family)
MTRREWLRMSGVLGSALASSVVCALDKPRTPVMNLKDPHTQSKAIDNIFIRAGLTAGNIPGAAVLVANNSGVLFRRGYGVPDLHLSRTIDAHTNFRLASCTKQFTAMAIMLLVHDGKVSYEDRLADIFPDFPEYGSAITIRNLLNHTSGVEDYEDLMPPPNSALPVEQIQIHDDGVLDLLKRQKSTKFRPGAMWAYSNSGYVLLGLVVQKISGKAFPDFLHQRIFQPLNMSNTIAYVHGENHVPNRAFGHSREGKSWVQTDQSPTSATLGDGGVYSSLDDLAKWDLALRRNTLLSQQEMKPALTPVKVPEGRVTEPDGSPASYGFGWFLNPYRGHQRMWHYGETIGFRTTIQRFVAGDLTIIILSNRADLNPSALALQVADLFLGSSA